MTFVTVARTRFKTVHGDNITCNLKTWKPYTRQPSPGGPTPPAAEPFEFIASGNPLTITMTPGSGSTETPIKTSEAILRVENLQAFKALGFLSSTNKSHMLEVLKGASVIWTGYMVPDQWYENFAFTPYESQFTFVDGITLLRGIPFLAPDGTYYRGRNREWTIFSRIIHLIGLPRVFVDQINILDVNTPASDVEKGSLYQRFKDLEAFRGLNCYEVLERLLVSCCSRIEYHSNAYWIKRIDEVDAEVMSAVYRPNTGGHFYYGTEWFPNKEQVVKGSSTSDNRLCWQDASQSIERIPGWKSFKFTQEYGRKESMLSRFAFDPHDWLSNGTLKNWNTNGIQRIEMDDDKTGVQFKAWELRPEPTYEQPAFIEQTTVDEYSPENVTNDNWEQFVLELVTQAGSYRYTEQGTYYGPRGRHSNTMVFNSVDNYQVRVEGAGPWTHTQVGGGLGFVIPVKDLSHELAVGDRFIFRDSKSCPEPFAPGVVYRVAQLTYQETNPNKQTQEKYYFRLREIDAADSGILSPYITISSEELGETFNGTFYFSYIPCLIRIKEAGVADSNLPSLDLRGNFMSRAFLDLEVQKADIDSKRVFTTGTQSESRPLTSGGPIYVRIEKTQQTVRARAAEGSWNLERVRLYFADVPERHEETVELTNMNTRAGDVTIHFAETPIKTNFKNNNLKFHNNFYSLDTLTPPGLQYYHRNYEMTQHYLSVYGFLYNWEAAKVLANTSTHAWRLPAPADMTNLCMAVFYGEPSAQYYPDVAWKLKSPRRVSVDGHPGWDKNPQTLDTFGFGILPAGYRQAVGGVIGFHAFTTWALMWIAGDDPRALLFQNELPEILTMEPTNPLNGYSVRLCRNLLPGETIADGAPGPDYIGNDGRPHPTVKIGNRVWLKVNLIETKTNTGVNIAEVSGHPEWAALTGPGRCAPGNNSAYAFDTIDEPTMPYFIGTNRDIVKNFYKALYINPRLQMIGTLNSNGAASPWGKVLQEKHTGCDYRMNDCNWDVRMNEYSGTWHEITKTTDDAFKPRGSYGKDYSDDYF